MDGSKVNLCYRTKSQPRRTLLKPDGNIMAPEKYNKYASKLRASLFVVFTLCLLAGLSCIERLYVSITVRHFWVRRNVPADIYIVFAYDEATK